MPAIVETASAWFPVEAATIPRATVSFGIDNSLLAAPRSLKAPVSCRFSSFRNTRAPVAAPSVGDGWRGVSRTNARMRRSAAAESIQGLAVRAGKSVNASTTAALTTDCSTAPSFSSRVTVPRQTSVLRAGSTT